MLLLLELSVRDFSSHRMLDTDSSKDHYESENDFLSDSDDDYPVVRVQKKTTHKPVGQSDDEEDNESDARETTLARQIVIGMRSCLS